jgi:hypothetical protein
MIEHSLFFTKMPYNQLNAAGIKKREQQHVLLPQMLYSSAFQLSAFRVLFHHVRAQVLYV